MSEELTGFPRRKKEIKRRKEIKVGDGGEFRVPIGFSAIVGSAPKSVRRRFPYERFITIRGLDKGDRLDECAVEFYYNEDGCPRVRKGSGKEGYFPENTVVVWSRHEAHWHDYTLGERKRNVPEEFWEIAGDGSIFVDMYGQTPDSDEDVLLVRLRESARHHVFLGTYERSYQVQIKPPKSEWDLKKR